MIEIFTGIIAVSGLMAALALLLEAADALFLNYGEVTIDINGGDKRLTVNGGGSLLATLMDQGVFVPSACGGRASCGLCKVEVPEGGGPVLPTETPYLSPEELKKNVRLSCQVKVRNDIAIRMDPALFSIREFRTTVAGLKDLTATIKEVRLALKDPPEIKFKAGQFIQFQAPAYKGSPDPVYRAYSIASPESRKNELTLCITRVKGGIATTYVHDYLKEGDEVTLNGPYGEFYLRESDREMIMIATGSGLAPLMSILYKMREAKSTRAATLFFGTYRPPDILYAEELKALEEELPNFRFVPVLSGATEEDHWEGETGIVTEPVQRLLAERGTDLEAYLCGNPLMIDAAVKIFTEHGMDEDQIYYDKFA